MRTKIKTGVLALDGFDVGLISRDEPIDSRFTIQNEHKIGSSMKSMADEKLQIDFPIRINIDVSNQRDVRPDEWFWR